MLLLHCEENPSYRVEKSLLGRETLELCTVFMWYVEFFKWSFLNEGLRLGESVVLG